ncbi:MAG: ABC transporter permease [Rhodobacteraceae bacterium]|nr:ABC transporter permease [Paracoccaceae bacterium]
MAVSATPLRRSLAIQSRVIGALLMREVLTRYGRHNIGFLWLFVEPMLFTLGITVFWTLARGSLLSGLPIVAFAVTGYSSVLLWRNMPNRCCHAIEPNLSLMYHRHVKIIDIFAARILLEIAGGTTSFVTLMLVFGIMGWMHAPEDVLKVILGWLMLAWFGAALALLIGALSARSELVAKIWHPMSYLLYPVSGAVFMVDWLPVRAQELVLLLPMVHGVELLREGYFGSMVHAHYDLPYMACLCLSLTLLGLALERISSRKVIPE